MMSLGLSGYSIAAPDAAPDAAGLEDDGGDGRAAPDAPELSLGGMKIQVFLLYIIIYYILYS